MTELLEKAIAQVRLLPESEQDHVAEMLMQLLADQDEVVDLDALDPETRAAIQEGLDQADRGEFVPKEEMAEFFRQRGA